MRGFGIRDTDKKESSQRSEQLVIDLFKQKLGLNWISHNDIDIAHRVGFFTEKGNRAIIVRLTTRKVKSAIILNRTKLKGSFISISEDLTHKNVRRLKQINELNCVEQSWSYDGKLFAKNSQQQKIEVKSSDTISENIFEVAMQRRAQAPLQHRPNAVQTPTVSEFAQKSSSKEDLLSAEEFKNSAATTKQDPAGSNRGNIDNANGDNQRNREDNNNNSKNSTSGKPTESKTGHPINNSNTNDREGRKKENGANQPDSQKEKHRDSHPNNDSADMDIGDVTSGSLTAVMSNMTPQHASSPIEERLQKIASYSSAIDDRMKQLKKQQK